MSKSKYKNVIKVRHFAAKTIDLGESLPLESLAIEILIGFILAVLAYQGYQAKLALLLFPCAIGAVVCFFIAIQTLYFAIKDHRESRRNGSK
ncbi:MAG: hypothetical protein CL866_01205 [Cycloclasticus sp.]|nr:hypothetical protein [Cycloclasticus sp.]MBG95477.1 hypothetical protein [Cycloclasticus sp.]|tara:strand:- start:67 stop:342 length:276 start_codon:yes stop_codon:yes gene_type:complete